LVVVAVTVAFGLAVDEDRFRKLGAIDAALDGDLESIEALTNAGACAQRGINGKVRKIRLNVRAAGLVGAQDEAPLEIDVGEAGRSSWCAVSKLTKEPRRLTVSSWRAQLELAASSAA
jgi:hypothetical protein